MAGDTDSAYWIVWEAWLAAMFSVCLSTVRPRFLYETTVPCIGACSKYARFALARTDPSPKWEGSPFPDILDFGAQPHPACLLEPGLPFGCHCDQLLEPAPPGWWGVRVFWVQKTVGWPPRAVSAAKFPQIFLTTCVEHDGCLWEALLDHPLGYLERQEGVTMWRISDALTRKRTRSRQGKGGRGRKQPHASRGGAFFSASTHGRNGVSSDSSMDID